MKASDFIADLIVKQGVKYVFGYQGGNIAHIIDSIWNNKELTFVSTYNEQGAAFAACGYAMESENIGIACASSGPGAINLISGIANAYYDSIPTMFITGNVSTYTMKTNVNVRQNAFQENDIVSMVAKITKYAHTVSDPHELRCVIEKAIYMAKEGRPGPVLIDIPHNIQKAELEFEVEEGFNRSDVDVEEHFFPAKEVLEAFKASSRPVIVVGGGVQNKRTRGLIHQLLMKWRVPVVTTLRGLDIIPHDSESYIGFGGAYGNRAANLAIQYADCMLVLGARLDERFISIADKALFQDKTIVHVDIDPFELGRVIPTEVRVNMRVDLFLEQIVNADCLTVKRDQWLSTVRRWSDRYPSLNKEWSVNVAAAEITRHAVKDAIFTLDIGLNQMSAAQSMELHGYQHCFTSAGHGAMGCALPMAIGAAFASREKKVNCFVGDGALHMNIQELLLVSNQKLPVHIILINNHCLGMIRDFQTKALFSRFAATVDELQNVDYKGIADAYRLAYFKVSSNEELTMAECMLEKEAPCIIELVFPEDTDTNPKLGVDMFHQLPLLSDEQRIQIEEEVKFCDGLIS